MHLQEALTLVATVVHILTLTVGGTPIGAVLNTVFNEHLNMIDDAAAYPQMYSKIPPLDIIVLTDGVPSKLPLITSLTCTLRVILPQLTIPQQSLRTLWGV